MAGLDALGDAARVHEGHLRVGLPEEGEAAAQRALIRLPAVVLPTREGMEITCRNCIRPLMFFCACVPPPCGGQLAGEGCERESVAVVPGAWCACLSQVTPAQSDGDRSQASFA